MRAGANLSEADKIRVRTLNQELSRLTTDFSTKLLAGTKAGALVVDKASDLDGLSPDEIETAAQAVRNCTICGNLDTEDPCNICREPHRDSQQRHFVRCPSHTHLQRALGALSETMATAMPVSAPARRVCSVIYRLIPPACSRSTPAKSFICRPFAPSSELFPFLVLRV